MKVQIEESWRRQLQGEFDKPYFERLVKFVKDCVSTRKADFSRVQYLSV